MAKITAIAKEAPDDFMEQIKDKIRLEFAEMVPEDKWREMVHSAVDSFFKSHERKQNHHPYNCEIVKSPFDTIVHQLLVDEITEKMQAYFMSPEWQGQWGLVSLSGSECSYVASERMKELMIECAPEIIQRMLGNTLQNAIQGLQFST